MAKQQNIVTSGARLVLDCLVGQGDQADIYATSLYFVSFKQYYL